MTRKTAIREADKWFSLYIRARDKMRVTCGAMTSDCSHVFRRGHHAARWNPANAYGQCRGCHYRHHMQSEAFLLDYAKRKLGMRKYEELKVLWQTVSNWKTYQIEEIAEYFRRKL